MSHCQLQTQFFAIMAHHKCTRLRLKSTVWVSKMVYLKTKFTTSFLQSRKLLTNSNVPHFKVTCKVFSSWCGLFFANCTLMDFISSRVGKSQLPYELQAYEEVRWLCVHPNMTQISIESDLEVQKTWFWLKATNLGHNAIV